MKTHKTRRPSLWQLLSLGALCIAASFASGIKTSTDVHPISPLEAEDLRITGDINGDSKVDLNDVVAILEVVRGYRSASAEELKADPNEDGQLTIDDAIRLIHDLQLSNAR